MSDSDNTEQVSKVTSSLILLATGIAMFALGLLPILAIYGVWIFARWIMPPPWGIVEWAIFIIAGGSTWFVFGFMTLMCFVNGIKMAMLATGKE